MARLATADTLRETENSLGRVLSDEERLLLQKRLLDVLDDIVAVCKKYDIPYSLGGGSVLGAIRHKGFIPWDDDLDIDIPRKQYERFLRLFAAEQGEKYWVRMPGKTKGHNLLFSQIRRKDTTLKGRDDFTNPEAGIPVDVFPIENTYDNALLRQIHGAGCMFFGYFVSARKFFQDRQTLRQIFPAGHKRLPYYAKVIAGGLVSFASLDAWVRRADAWNARCKNEHSKFVTVPAGRKYFFGELCKRREWSELTQVLFAGREVSVPHAYDQYLTRMYGNYAEIPPENQREKHLYYPPILL